MTTIFSPLRAGHCLVAPAGTLNQPPLGAKSMQCFPIQFQVRNYSVHKHSKYASAGLRCLPVTEYTYSIHGTTHLYSYLLHKSMPTTLLVPVDVL